MFKKKRLFRLILALVLVFGATSPALATNNEVQDSEELSDEKIAQKIAEELEFYFEKVGHITDDGKYEIDNPELLQKEAEKGNEYAQEILEEYYARRYSRGAKEVGVCALKDQFAWVLDLIDGQTYAALGKALGAGAWSAAGKILQEAIMQASKAAGKTVGWVFAGASAAYSIYKCRHLW
ncbi:MAG: hypothetical protein Q4P28_04220 [Tissierellia bacterium]|nr:hypothetical protein [Tissierellia bacterium]